MWTYYSKSETIKFIQILVNLIKNQYNMKIFFIHLDNKLALSTTFIKLYSRNSITIKKVPTYIKKPNRKIEYTRKKILIKVYYIDIVANLS